jgi:hypothetical protein
MFSQSVCGRSIGLSIISVLFLSSGPLFAGGGAASSQSAEVAIEYKKTGLLEFQLADFEEELLECSGLAAVHMWISDNIGSDAGSGVRASISEDYWLDISHDYLSLAKQASGKEDMSKEVRVHIRGLTAEWYRLTETKVSPEDWSDWYELVDRCETWRPANSARSYYNKGRDVLAKQDRAQDITG